MFQCRQQLPPVRQPHPVKVAVTLHERSARPLRLQSARLRVQAVDNEVGIDRVDPAITVRCDVKDQLLASKAAVRPSQQPGLHPRLVKLDLERQRLVQLERLALPLGDLADDLPDLVELPLLRRPHPELVVEDRRRLGRLRQRQSRQLVERRHLRDRDRGRDDPHARHRRPRHALDRRLSRLLGGDRRLALLDRGLLLLGPAGPRRVRAGRLRRTHLRRERPRRRHVRRDVRGLHPTPPVP